MGMDKLLVNTKETLKQIEAEFWGTFFIVFFGVSSYMDWSSAQFGGAPSPSLVTIAMEFGFAVCSMVLIFGQISGAHLNPAVSLGLVTAGECTLAKAGVFIVTQVFGSFTGASAASLVLHPKMFAKSGIGITSSLSKLNGVTPWQGVLMEFIITAPLIFTICAITDKGRKDIGGSAPLAIGLAITLGHIAGIPVTGASMNPARSIGPLIAAVIGKGSVNSVGKQTVEKAMGDLWVGPTLGGVFAGAVYRTRFAQRA